MNGRAGHHLDRQRTFPPPLQAGGRRAQVCRHSGHVGTANPKTLCRKGSGRAGVIGRLGTDRSHPSNSVPRGGTAISATLRPQPIPNEMGEWPTTTALSLGREHL